MSGVSGWSVNPNVAERGNIITNIQDVRYFGRNMLPFLNNRFFQMNPRHQSQSNSLLLKQSSASNPSKLSASSSLRGRVDSTLSKPDSRKTLSRECISTLSGSRVKNRTDLPHAPTSVMGLPPPINPPSLKSSISDRRPDSPIVRMRREEDVRLSKVSNASQPVAAQPASSTVGQRGVVQLPSIEEASEKLSQPQPRAVPSNKLKYDHPIVMTVSQERNGSKVGTHYQFRRNHQLPSIEEASKKPSQPQPRPVPSNKLKYDHPIVMTVSQERNGSKVVTHYQFRRNLQPPSPEKPRISSSSLSGHF